MKNVLVALCALGLLAASAGTARALVYGNPAHSYKSGDNTLGVFLENETHPASSGGLGDFDLHYTTLVGSYGFGMGSHGLLELQLGVLVGNADLQDSAVGFAYGLTYRHNLTGGGGGVQQGLILAVHGAYAGNDTTDTYITQLDAGYGLAFPMGDAGALYVGAVLTSFFGTLDVFGVQAYDFDGATPITLFGGFAVNPSPSSSMGVELHLLGELGVGFFLTSRF
jgi:hypothetical protein